MKSIVLTLAFGLALPVFAAELNSAQWHADLDFLTATIAAEHPDPWSHTDQAEFNARVQALRGQLPSLDLRQVTVELMRLVALLGDGHSELMPTGEQGFRRWYPLRFHRFSDGIYLTALPAGLESVRGTRITRINGREAGTVIAEVTALFGADNRFGQEVGAFLASSADILQGLGVVAADQALVLEFEPPDGGPPDNLVSHTLQPQVGEAHMDWRFWGEHFGPPGVETLSAFELEDAMNFLTAPSDERPLHLRHRAAYQYVHRPDERLVYFQFNAVTEQSSRSEQSLFETWEEALKVAQANPEAAQRLVIDLRYNFGGDGSLAPAFLNKLLRLHPFVETPGHVFLVTGPATFSAGIMIAEEIMRHVPAILVGLPMGAPLNHFGDAEDFTLPNSGYTLSLSSRWWQFSTSDDARRFIPVQIPAPMSGNDYFAGRDPMLAAILAQPAPYPTLDRIVTEHGAAALAAAYADQHGRWGGLDWWQPVGRMDMEYAGDALEAAGRLADAIAAYRINTQVFPDDWDTWDDLGALCLKAEDKDCVRDAYRRALELNPSNWNAPEQRAALAELGD